MIDNSQIRLMRTWFINIPSSLSTLTQWHEAMHPDILSRAGLREYLLYLDNTNFRPSLIDRNNSNSDPKKIERKI